MSEEEGYVWRKKSTLEKVKVPDGNVKCPTCKGSGEIRVRWGQPWDRGQFMDCLTCEGKGFLEKKFLDELRKIGAVKMNDSIKTREQES